ncbi:hypothetical protein MBLNU457_3112t1 [Dothideomycetes sp. NU457]
MPSAPVVTKQTAKQAKAAFKARGSLHVSSAERRKLERGAQLLERADRIKAQERRKKEWMKKRDEQGVQQKNEEDSKILGSQLRLDKFGYKSSQFHLGRFFGRPKEQAQAKAPNLSSVKVGAVEENMDDYEDVDEMDEDIMLGLDPSSSDVLEPDQTAHVANDWTDFLESSTQIARELSDETPEQSVIPDRPKKQSGRSRSLASIPSWNSDEAFDEEELAALENQLASVHKQNQTDKDKLLMPPPKIPAPSNSSASGMLPPARLSRPGMVPPPKQPPPKPSTLSMPPPPKPSTSAMPPPPKPSTNRPTRSVPSMPSARRNNNSIPPQASTSSSTINPPHVHTASSGHKATPLQSRRDSTSSLAPYGISAADLECLAADDIVLSQWAG